MENHIYQITIKGHFNLNLSDVVEKVHIEHETNGATVLTCSLPDQTALFGLLMRIRDLGLTLIEVKQVTNSNRF